MTSHREMIRSLYSALPDETREFLDRAVAGIVAARKNNGKVVVVTGSGPNLHEGVTTLIAELIHKDVIHGVTTSSAVIAHEMAGALDQVKRVDGRKLGFSEDILPRGFSFELTLMPDELLQQLEKEMIIDMDLIKKIKELDGDVIIKAAGNMAYPMGLRSEQLTKDILFKAKNRGVPFETVAGAGADPRTMLGAAYANDIPVLVTIPQLVGGGMVGLAIGDSISITERSSRVADMLGSADVIIESAVALTQEIHDGPFEMHTGHGIWAHWEGIKTYSLENKILIRIDLDPSLKKAWDFDKRSNTVQDAIDKGLPKTKMMDIPFRMEMSGFARLEKSIPVVADVGVVWPIMAVQLEQELGFELDFLSAPQQTPEGQKMRQWIVDNVRPIDKSKLSF
jgi:deoxyhypusine synthase